MTTHILARACALFVTFLFLGLPVLQAESMQGTVTDPTGAPIAGARVAAINRVGLIGETVTNASGRFEINVPNVNGVKLIITANGFSTATITAGSQAQIKLTIDPVVDSVAVIGSAVDVAASELGTSVSIITGEEIRQRNEAQVIDLLRYLPGVYVAQSGPRGAVGSVSIRGGDTKNNLVQIDGVPVNSFYYGGYFDFSQVPSDFLERVEVARGPQSAIYGSYANSGVVSFVTRSPENGPRLDLVAEGGTYGERRFAISGSGLVKGIGISGSLSRLDYNGPVQNSDFMNENVFLNVTKKWTHQSISAFGNYDANDTGEPGPYGSNPLHLYSGIDTVSRSRNYFSDYGLHYQIDLTPSVRQEFFGSFFLNNSPYISPYGYSYNKDIRGQAEERTSWNVAKYWTMAAGFVFAREEMKNTYITDASSRNYPLRRDEEGLYWDNQFQIGRHFYLNAGVRADFFQQPLIPPTQYRATLPAQDYFRVNPKVSAAYMMGAARLHGSFGTGIRPPGGSELAFTDNPALRPEKSLSFDVGVEQRLWNNRISFDATYFYSRYTDVIVSLGGNLSVLGSYQTDNLARSRAKGIEFSGQLRPVRWFTIGGNYTHLDTTVLSLSGSSDLVQKYYTIGQELPRRPANSGSLVSTFYYQRLSVNVLGFFRGQTLDVEPNFGVSQGFFKNPGYENIGINVNFDAGHGVTLYGNLRNALNQRYEEIYGYPAPILNFVAGVKWSLPGGGK